MPLDAVPQDVIGADGANEELENKLPAAHTEQGVAGNGKDNFGSGYYLLNNLMYKIITVLVSW